jgi:hypothetical protein
LVHQRVTMPRLPITLGFTPLNCHADSLSQPGFSGVLMYATPLPKKIRVLYRQADPTRTGAAEMFAVEISPQVTDLLIVAEG